MLLSGCSSCQSILEDSSDGGADGSIWDNAIPLPSFAGEELDGGVSDGGHLITGCGEKAGDRKAIMLEKLRLITTIVSHDRPPVALIMDSRRRKYMIGRGDYLGPHCHHVSVIGPEYMVVEEPYVGADGGPQTRQLRIRFGETP